MPSTVDQSRHGSVTTDNITRHSPELGIVAQSVRGGRLDDARIAQRLLERALHRLLAHMVPANRPRVSGIGRPGTPPTPVVTNKDRTSSQEMSDMEIPTFIRRQMD